MIKLLLFSLFLILILSLTLEQETMRAGPYEQDANSQVDTCNVNLTASLIHWKGTKMRGLGKHEGKLTISKGLILLQNKTIIGGEFTMDMNSIAVTDIPESDPIPRRNLEKHLMSEDFFYSDKYPFAIFSICETMKIDSHRTQISGSLNMKDEVHQVTFIAMYQGASYHAEVILDRFLWKITYAGNWLERTLVDRFIELNIQLVLD